MAFVFKILDNEDKNFLEKFDLRNPFNNRYKASVYSWVKDEEKNIYFFSLGGQGTSIEAPEIFNLYIENQRIEIFAYNKFLRHFGRKELIIEWTIFKIYLSEQFTIDKQEIKELIMDAFSEFGDGIKNFEIVTVVFGSISEPKYMLQ